MINALAPLSWVVGLLLTMVTLPGTALLLCLSSAVLLLRERKLYPKEKSLRLAILVPAHN